MLIPERTSNKPRGQACVPAKANVFREPKSLFGKTNAMNNG